MPINNELSTETIFVPQQVYEKGEWINTTAEWVKDREFVTKEIHSNKISNPFNTYNEILLMADLFDTFAKNGLKITYDVLFQNCNTWTSFINKEYFDDVDVFSLFDDIGYIGSDVPILFMKMNILEKYIENSIIEYYEISIFKLLERIAVYLIQNSIDFSSTVLTIKKYLSGITCILTSEVGKTIFEEKHPFFPSLKDLITETTEKVDTASETRSPLAIDLDGDGVETVSVDNGVYFDHDGNGFAEKTGWIGKDDGILVRDLNNNGQIDDGSELFGDQTILSNGEKAANGFEALADLDSNHDGVFDGDDDAFGEIKVWQDLNQNGVVDDGELKTLNEAGITSINLNYQNQTITDNNGNEHNQTGSFTKTDATTGTITDVWFDVDYADTIDLANVEISDEIAELPNVDGFGNVHDLHTAMALDTTGTLKTLVEQYFAATDFDTRDAILLNLIYTWAGVADIDPESRAATQIYGNVIGDARKLETLEEFLGEEYLGTWCWGERDPNPHGQAAPLLLEAFEKLKDYIEGALLAQTHYQEYVDSIALNWNEETQEWTVDVTEALTKLQTAFAAQGTNASLFLNKVVSALNVYGELGAQAISALKNAGDENGTAFEIALATLGEQNVGTSGNDIISGTEENDTLYGLAGNDMLSGKNGNDTLIGGAGNDTLNGGAGDDTYIFGRGYDQDTISDAQGENTLHITQADYDNLWFEREGNNLKVSILGTEDSMTVNSWYSNKDARLFQIQTDTKTIGTADIELLVQAMSSFSQPNTGAISQDASLSGGFKETVTRLWQART